MGGIGKSVAFVRKAMAKTKQQNDGYNPPARYGYDFPTAVELDKPSEHIQRNIGERDDDEIVKYKYDRRKKGDKSPEELRREQVHKFAYWGLTANDFEEVDGKLVEKKHGFLWPPLYYKPPNQTQGYWGLRCCRYDKDGDTIPSSKKYEFIYFRKDDPLNKPVFDGKVVPNPAMAEGRYYRPAQEITTLADPPLELTNNDGEEDVELEGFYAKAKLNRLGSDTNENRGANRPFFWRSLLGGRGDSEYIASQEQYCDGEKAGKGMVMWMPSRIPVKSDIRQIILANEAMSKSIKKYLANKTYGEEGRRRQIEKWDKALADMNPKRYGATEKLRTNYTDEAIADRLDLPRDLSSRERAERISKERRKIAEKFYREAQYLQQNWREAGLRFKRVRGALGTQTKAKVSDTERYNRAHDRAAALMTIGQNIANNGRYYTPRQDAEEAIQVNINGQERVLMGEDMVRYLKENPDIYSRRRIRADKKRKEETKGLVMVEEAADPEEKWKVLTTQEFEELKKRDPTAKARGYSNRWGNRGEDERSKLEDRMEAASKVITAIERAITANEEVIEMLRDGDEITCETLVEIGQ